MTARPSHTPESAGCVVSHRQWHTRHSPVTAERPASTAARTAGSILSTASWLAFDICRDHSLRASAAACHAARNCSDGVPSLALTIPSSHPASAVASAGRRTRQFIAVTTGTKYADPRGQQEFFHVTVKFLLSLRLDVESHSVFFTLISICSMV